MKDLTPKFDNTGGATGQLTAEEFNDMRNDAQNAVEASGQTLTVAVGDDNLQLLKAISAGGKTISRGDAETADIGDIVEPDNSAGAVTINLPSAGLFVGARVRFSPVTDQLYSEFSLTVGRNGNDIEDDATDFVMDSTSADNAIVDFVWMAGSIGWQAQFIGIIGATI